MNFPDQLHSLWRGKRFNSFNRVLRDHFGKRVYKVACPNRDGTVAIGGCIYCNDASHTPANYRPRTHNTIHRQLIRSDAWQGRLYTKAEIRTSLPSMYDEGAVL